MVFFSPKMSGSYQMIFNLAHLHPTIDLPSLLLIHTEGFDPVYKNTISHRLTVSSDQNRTAQNRSRQVRTGQDRSFKDSWI